MLSHSSTLTNNTTTNNPYGALPSAYASVPPYPIQVKDCTVRRDQLGGHSQWTAPIPPGVTRVVTPQGQTIAVDPFCKTLNWIVSDHYPHFNPLRSDVKTHAKVNGGKLMFQVITRETLDGFVYVVQFNSYDVFTGTETYEKRDEAEKAGAKFVGKAVQKLLTA